MQITNVNPPLDVKYLLGQTVPYDPANNPLRRRFVLRGDRIGGPLSPPADAHRAFCRRAAAPIAAAGNTLHTEKYRRHLEQYVTNLIEQGTFPPAIWHTCAVYSDQCRYNTMTCALDQIQPPPAYQTPNSANTWCLPNALSAPYASATAGLDLPNPRPGFSGSTINREYREAWHAQRTIIYTLPKKTLPADPRPLWLYGTRTTTITADGQTITSMGWQNISAERLYAPHLAAYATIPQMIGRRRLPAIDPFPSLPPAGGTVTYSEPISLLLNNASAFRDDYWGVCNYLAVTLSPASSRGRYHYGCTSIRVTSQYSLTLYQARLTPF